MRLRKVCFRGLTVFNQPTVLDLDAGGRLLALVGRNGQGKTTAMEAVIGALYGAFPSRPGSIYDWCKGRDAYIEAEFSDLGERGNSIAPRRWTVRVTIDAEKRTMERYLFSEGIPATTGRAKEFEEQVTRLFGSYDLLMASAFAAQAKNGSFMLLPKVQRKALFAELLGLGQLERLGEAAKARRACAEAALAEGRTAMNHAEEQVRDLPAAETRLAAADTAVLEAQEALEAARTAEAAAVRAYEEARAAEGRLQARQQALETARGALRQADAAVATAESGEGEARRRAEQRRKEATARDLGEARRTAQATHRNREVFLDNRERDLTSLLADEAVAQAAAEELPALEARQAELQKAAAAMDVASGAMARAKQALEAAERRRDDAVSALGREKTTLEDRVALLGRVPCTAALLWEDPNATTEPAFNLAGSCPLLADARGAKEKAATLQLDPARHEDVSRAMVAVEAASRTLTERQEALDPAALEALAQRLPVVRREAARVEDMKRARHELERLGSERAADDTTRAEILREIDKDETARLKTLAGIEADLKADLSGAKDVLYQAMERQKVAIAEMFKAEQAVAGEDQSGVPAREEDRDEAGYKRYHAENKARETDAARAAAHATLTALLDVDAGMESLGEAVTAAEQEVGDWIFLDQAFGRDGIQALEIDAAGPEVASISNDLLEAGGSAFRISFETQRAKKSKPGEFTESFDVKVYAGAEERLVEGLSGGEKVVVGEAIGLALAIYNARKSGVKWRTIFRDETAGALDPASAQAYVDMLRRALDLGGFDQAVFIAHTPEVYERADTRFYVSGGRISMEATS